MRRGYTWTCEHCGYEQFLETPCNCEGPGTPLGARRIRIKPLPNVECGGVFNGEAVTRIDRLTSEIDLMRIEAFAKYFQAMPNGGVNEDGEDPSDWAGA